MEHTEIAVGKVKANGLMSINVLLGRNGAGKSRFLRTIDQELSKSQSFNVRYISPERTGIFQRNGNIMTTMEQDPNWLPQVRRKNQAENFKAASANFLRDIETEYLRKLQDTPEIRQNLSKNFRIERLEKINKLLANLSIYQEGPNFIFRNNEGTIIEPDQISSGESEAVALAVEIMHFFYNANINKFNVLLLDEPDVHLHPDLQARLSALLITLINELNDEMINKVAVFIATHSTPLVCSLSQFNRTTIGTKDFGVDEVSFQAVNQQLKKIAPFFGHPLSLYLSQDPIIILEGEDDERVFHQAVRSSQGKIRLFPVLATSVDQQTQLESFSADVLDSLYDEPIAYSLRDGDGIFEDLTNIRSMIRLRLQCYSIENLLLTDQALAILGITWDQFTEKAREWLNKNQQHKDFTKINQLIIANDRLRNTKIKDIRQLICAIAGSNKPWEVVVGQAIGSLTTTTLHYGEFDLSTFIGSKTINALFSL